MVSGDYVMTIDSDDEAPIQPTKAKDESVQLDMNFVFDPSVDTLTETWNNASDLGDLVKTGSRPVRMASTPDCLIHARFLSVYAGTYFR
jgi:hypothetical protein